MANEMWENAGNFLRECRQQHGMSMAELGREIEHGPSLISKLENGQTTVGNGVLRKLEDALELNHGVLIAKVGRLPSDLQPLTFHEIELLRLHRQQIGDDDRERPTHLEDSVYGEDSEGNSDGETD